MQQFSKSFLKLLEVFRAEDDDSPADFLIFSRKAQLLLDILQENAIKTLSSEEFRGKAFAGSALEKNPKKFFIPFGETLRFGLSPMQAVRNLVKKNEFIQFPSLTSSFSEGKLNKTANSREKTAKIQENSSKLLENAGKQREETLKITRPACVSTKVKVFEPKVEKIPRISTKRPSLPGNFVDRTANSREKPRDYVTSHAKGFKNPENRDFFKHLLRLFAKNQAIVAKVKPNADRRRASVGFFEAIAGKAGISEAKAEKLAIKSLCLEKYLRNFAVFERIMEKVQRKTEKVEEIANNCLENQQTNVVTLSAEVLSWPKTQKLWHEEVFLLNILEKVATFGLKSLNQTEISSFQAIFQSRKQLLAGFSREIQEKAEKNPHFSTIIENFRAFPEENSANASKNGKNAGISPKKRRLSETFAYFSSFHAGNLEKPHETQEKSAGFQSFQGNALKRREKLKPLTVISPQMPRNTGNSDEILENIEFRLEIAKKKLFEREDLGDLPGKWFENAEKPGDFLGLWNRPSQKYRKKSAISSKIGVFSAKTEKTREKLAISLDKPQKIAEKPEAENIFTVFSSKLKEKALSFKEKAENFKENRGKIANLKEKYQIKTEFFQESAAKIEESEEFSTPPQSKRGSVKKIHRFSAINSRKGSETPEKQAFSVENSQKVAKKAEDFKEIAKISEKNREIIERLKPLLEKNHENQENRDQTPKSPEKQRKKPSVFKEKAELVVDYTKSLKKLMKMPETRENLPKTPENLLKPAENLENIGKKVSVFAKTAENTKNLSNFTENDGKSQRNAGLPQENRENIKKTSTLSIETGKSPVKHEFLAKKSSLLHEIHEKFSKKPEKSEEKPVKTEEIAEKPRKTEENPTNSKKSSVFSQVSRTKTSSFSKFSVIKLKNSKKSRADALFSELFREDTPKAQEIPEKSPEIAESQGNLKENASFHAKPLEPQENPREISDLDELLLKDMAFLEKKALKMQQFRAKNSTLELSNQNSSEMLSPKNTNIERLTVFSSKNSLKDPKPVAKPREISPNPGKTVKDSALAREKSGTSAQNNEKSSSFSIENGDFQGDWADNDPLFQDLRRNSHEKPLRLAAFEEINAKSPAISSKNDKKTKNFAFLWEDTEKPAGNSLENAGIARNSREIAKKVKEIEGRPSILLTPSIISPPIASFRRVFPKNEAEKSGVADKKERENNENSVENDQFFLNPTPLLKKPAKKSTRDVPENPYESLKILHTEQDFSKKKLLQQSQSRSHSKNGQELSDSASSGELNLLDLMKHELKRSENIKLGDLKQGIEENISKIAEDTDEEAKFHMMLYANRKEQLQKYIELASENQQSWLSQPDCVEQLRGFLLEKNRNFNDYEKNSALKFCCPIQLPKNEALQSILNKNGKDLALNAEQHEKFVEFMMKLNEEAFQERERRKKFRTERQMLRVLREFLGKTQARGKVLQKGLKESRIVREIAEQRENLQETREKTVENNRNSTKSSEFAGNSKKMQDFAQKIKRLKAGNPGKFDELLQKMKKIKQCEYVFY